ncbi:GNAT family N-acyltransferase [Oleiphilus messinensis]|uniref:GNAT family N-acyltransferase n=1 Tax=Oleiphilus messinensis TaxID=141451 RepID=UPI0012F8097A|nr:GNAT family N-acyltransferase [Oleiphilus messinensis]
MLAELKHEDSVSALKPVFLCSGIPTALVWANTDELREESYRIRYEVYCRHLGFEDEQKYPEGQESDRFDLISNHFLVQDLETSNYVGTVRLVEPGLTASPLDAIPLESVYRKEYEQSTYCPAAQRSGSYLEVSRLALLTHAWQQSGTYSSELARLLYLASLAYFYSLPDMKRIYCLMEPRLAYRLNRIGLPFDQVGQLIQFKGDRAPYMLQRSGCLQGLRGEARSIFSQALAQMRRSNIRDSSKGG